VKIMSDEESERLRVMLDMNIQSNQALAESVDKLTEVINKYNENQPVYTVTCGPIVEGGDGTGVVVAYPSPPGTG